MLKTVIVTEGGKNIGFGHITRCLSLSQAFEEKGIGAKFIVNGDGVAKDLLKDKRYKLFNWLRERERLYNLLEDIEIAIIDSYLADLGLYKKLSNIVEVPVYIDDNKRLEYPRGLVVNASAYAEELNYPQREDILYLLGSQYIPLRKEFWDESKKEINKKIKSIMITFGGNDKKNMTSKILKRLNEEYPKIIKNLIISKGFKNIEEIEGLRNKETNFIYGPDADRMKMAMLESDIAISAGGQTLYELARIGVPTIGICFADNQLRNLNRWKSIGFLEFVGWYNDNNLFKIIKKALERLDFKKRRDMSRRGKESIDGEGANRVVNEILKGGQIRGFET